MAKKRKASPKRSPQYGERRSKRRQMASINRYSKEYSSYDYGPSPGTSTIPSPGVAYMSMRGCYEPQLEFRGKALVEDLTKLIRFLESVAGDKDFLCSNHITEIANTLEIARHSLGRDAPVQGVAEGLVQHGETLFAVLKTKYAPKLSEMLLDLVVNVKLKSRVAPSRLLRWHCSVDQNLQDLKDYADEYGLGEEWEYASAKMKQIYEETNLLSKPQGAVSERSNTIAIESSTTEQSVEVSTQMQSAESGEEPLCPVELLTGPRNAEKANQIFDHLIAYYQRQIVNAPGTGISHIFRDLRTIKLCLAKLFSDSVELKCVPENLFGQDKFLAYHAWRLRFEAIWAAPVSSALQKTFRDLITMNDQPLGRVELICFELARDLESLAIERDFLESASQQYWDYLAPRLLSEASAKRAANDLEKTYLAFQDHTYAGSELTHLWLLVWRTLKVVKLPLPKEPEEAMLPEKGSEISKIDMFAIDRLFFESGGNPSPSSRSLWNCLRRGDVNNPQWIEGYVSKYCNHVAKCYEEKERYYWQFSTMGIKPVPATVISTLQASNQQSIAHPRWNMLLHRVVLRLNHLLGDQKVLKRWWRDKKTQRVTYLDVSKFSPGIRDRGHGQPSGDPPTPDAAGTNKENCNGASDRPSGGFVLRNTAGTTAGQDGQDGEDDSDSKSSDKKGHVTTSNSSTSAEGTSSDGDDGDNKSAGVDSLPPATEADIDASIRNSTAPDSPPLPYLRPEDNEAAAAELHGMLDEFSSSVPDTSPSRPRMPSSSPLNPSDQENVVQPADAGALATRVLPSAFPYVNYPLGETRASERAMSMQIAREMRQGGIVTSGAHVEDVQNTPPEPLRLVPNHNDVFAPSRSPGILRRSIDMLQRLFRPPPAIVPARLPSLPPRRSPRRPTPSPLTANRRGTSGVQRARDRSNRSARSQASHSARPGGSQLPNPSFTPQHSWLQNLPENIPWDSPNQSPNPPPSILQDIPSVGVGERRPWSITPPKNTTARHPSRLSGIFLDRNTIRRPITPTPENGRGRTRDTNRGITAGTVQLSPEQGASTPPRIGHPGDGTIVGAGPDGDPENAIPPWEWIPEDNPHYQAFLARDHDLVRRGDTARVAAHRAIDALEENWAGHAVMIELYQLLRVRYEWGLTRDYRFPQHVPGYYRPPVPVGTPRIYRWFRGGAGTPPGHLSRSPPGEPERNADQPVERASATGSSPWFYDLLPDPNLLIRAARPQSWDPWNSSENVSGNQDFDLYDSTGAHGYQPEDGRDQLGQDQQEPDNSLSARQELIQRRHSRRQPGSQGSISTFSLPNPIHPEQPTGGRNFFNRSSSNGSRRGRNRGSCQGSASPVRSLGPATPRGRRTSGVSSLGLRGSPLQWPQSSDIRSQPELRPIARRDGGDLNLGEGRMQAAPHPRMAFSDIQATSPQSIGAPPNDVSHQDNGAGIQNVGDQIAGNAATPTREQYTQMTMQQLRDEITYRGGEPRNLRQRKEDFVQALLGYDVEGNRGNGAQPRQRRTAITHHPTLSPRTLRPRDNGKVTRKK